jgi:hypothetical protein
MHFAIHKQVTHQSQQDESIDAKVRNAGSAFGNLANAAEVSTHIAINISLL